MHAISAALSLSPPLTHTHTQTMPPQTILSILKPASSIFWLVPSQTFLLASHMQCCAFFVWASFDKSESFTMRGCSPGKYSLQPAIAGFRQICEDLNKDKIRCKQINQGREERECSFPSTHHTASIYVMKVVSGQFLLKCVRRSQ